MSLQTRLTALAQAVGADIKSINTQIAGLSGGGSAPTVNIDGGATPSDAYDNTSIDGGASPTEAYDGLYLADNVLTTELFTTKGDLLAATGDSVVTRIPVGDTNNWVLTVDSLASAGISWKAPVAPSNMLTTDTTQIVAGSKTFRPTSGLGIVYSQSSGPEGSAIGFGRNATAEMYVGAEGSLTAAFTDGVAGDMFLLGKSGSKIRLGLYASPGVTTNSLLDIAVDGVTSKVNLYEGANRVYSAGNPPPPPATMLTTDTTQTVSGAKTLNNVNNLISGRNFSLYAAGLTDVPLYLRGFAAQTSTVHAIQKGAGQVGDFLTLYDSNGTTVISRIAADGGIYDNGNRVYSDSNPPETLERTIHTPPVGNPPAGESFEWTPDGKSLYMRAPDGTDTKIGPSTGGSSNARIELIKTADQAIQHATAATFVDVTDLSWTVLANTTYEIEGIVWFTVAATTTGHRWGFTGPSGLSTIIFEYQTSATAWATHTQMANNVALGTQMVIVTASASASVPNIVRIKGLVRVGGTGGTLKLMGASELNSASVTVLKGSNITYRAV